MSTSYYKNESVFSAGGVLIDSTNKKLLLVFKQASGEWLLPKGHIENGETIEAAAEREIFEETGYKNKIKNLLSVQVRPDLVDVSKSKVIFWFLSLLTSDQQVANTQTESENFTGKWFSRKDAIGSLKWDDDKKLIEKVLEIA